MARKHKAYHAYKSSDIEWLGDTPEHWEFMRMDFRCESVKVSINQEQLSGKEVFHYSIPSIQENGDGRIELGDDIKSSKTLISEPSLLISRLNPRKGCIIMAQPQNIMTICSGEFVPLIPKKDNPKYLEYLYRSERVRQYLDSTAVFATKSRQRTKPSYICKLYFGCPPLAEQQAIADFLDAKSEQINSLIEKKQKQMELLQEKRAALITQAVTKGLEPKVKMKPSGIGWLRNVPEHWGINKLKHRVALISEKIDGSNNSLPYTALEHIQSWTGKKIVSQNPAENDLHEDMTGNLYTEGDVLFGKLRPYLAKVLNC